MPTPSTIERGRHSLSRTSAGVPVLSMTEISDLSDAVISRLTRDELLELIDSAATQVRLTRLPEAVPLQLKDIETLRRVAHLARFACRNLIRCGSLRS